MQFDPNLKTEELSFPSIDGPKPLVFKLNLNSQFPNFANYGIEENGSSKSLESSENEQELRVDLVGSAVFQRNRHRTQNVLPDYRDLEERVLLLALDEACDLVMECPFEIYDESDILKTVLTCAGTLTNFNENDSLKLVRLLQTKKTKAR